MKRFLCFLTLFIAFNVTLKAQSKDEKDVASAVEKLKAAMVDGDRQALTNIAAAELTYGHSSGKIEDKATFVESIVSGKSDFVTIDLTDQTIKVSGNTAIVRHSLSAETNDSGNPGSVKLGVLLVWQKQQGQWKLLARQAYKI
ncbi:nuclear transport factor 2 family protein [Pontibacter silvestris]|uniref:Nuclear transport factor 2 family protein n=1 Tax=Pontibacter silvestris TaxID=2305183 RepID=A0ABW4X2Q1_9BACT|nr:nuclear transport factor 2 family protein [Pontibacter silvestris]MCC9137072.1 nuclear transport factor 2 family protein [Pontibacter silvestris]